MPAYYDAKRRSWRCIFRLKDANGKIRQTQKRGFKSKREALDYERRQIISSSGSMLMSFREFYEGCYAPDVCGNHKPTTLRTKENIVNNHILPFFEDMRMIDITPKHILHWMNNLKAASKNNKAYSDEYLRSIYKCLKAIFNHAARYYSLDNPMKRTENFQKSSIPKKQIWTLAQYYQFAAAVKKEGDYFEMVLFNVMFFTGLRISELLALTIANVDTERKFIYVTQSVQIINGSEVLLSPKTLSSYRGIPIPAFLADELQEYILRLPVQNTDARLFPSVSRNSIYRSLNKYSKLANVPRVTPHCLRHSYITHMLHQNVSPIDLCPIVGHRSPATLYRYSHSYRDMQTQMMKKLDDAWKKLSE